MCADPTVSAGNTVTNALWLLTEVLPLAHLSVIV